MWRKFPINVQEFQAKWRKFPAQLAHVQEEYEEALNSSRTCQKDCDFAGIFPTRFHFYLKSFLHFSQFFLHIFLHFSECAGSMLLALFHVQEVVFSDMALYYSPHLPIPSHLTILSSSPRSARSARRRKKIKKKRRRRRRRRKKRRRRGRRCVCQRVIQSQLSVWTKPPATLWLEHRTT